MKLTQFNPKLQTNQMSSAGQYKLLNDGNEMGVLIVMLRESIQNSWDARVRNSKNVKFSLRGVELNDKNNSAIYNAIGREEDGYGFKISEIIRNQGTALEISDSNTLGLCGSTGFENLKGNGDKNRFIKFVHTLGNAGQTGGDGGSFGFGKTSLYKASKVGTVGIYTRTVVNGQLESRFIIKSIDKVNDKGFANTGVYWWGGDKKRSKNLDEGSWIEPLFDQEADKVWQSIGGSHFPENETGTKLLIFSPKISSDYALSGHSLMHANLVVLARNITHYFWAKWSKNSTDQGITFKVSINEDGYEKDIPIDHPDRTSPYNIFRSCLEIAVKSNKNSKKEDILDFYSKEIKSYLPNQSLGYFIYKVIEDREIAIKYTSFFERGSSHIALLRNVEFVVDYYNFPLNIDILSSDNGLEKKIIGVFRTHDDCLVYTDSSKEKKLDLNDVYRTAENQTHETWSSENALVLGDYCKTYINKTFNEIKSGLNSFVRDQKKKNIDRTSESKAQIMSYLGQFISGVQGGGQPITGRSKISTESSLRTKDSSKKTVNFEIISVVGPDVLKGKKIMSLECLLESKSMSEGVKLVPVCADEEGKLTLKPDKESSLPVRILSVDADLQAKVLITDLGTAEIMSERSKLRLNIELRITGDCRFIIKAD